MTHTLVRVISGGQTGVDIAALRAAHSVGVPTGGSCPRGWETENGPAPWLAFYGLRQDLGWVRIEARRATNIIASDGTLIMGDIYSEGALRTYADAYAARKHRYRLPWAGTDIENVDDIVHWIRKHEIHTLNVSGNQESHYGTGISFWAERLLVRVFRKEWGIE